jgi:hypothetical protein
VQNLVATGDPAKLGALYQRYREVYPTLFTNLTDLGAIGAYDAPSFCQYGVFPSNNTSFIFCAMQKGNDFGTVAVGFPPPNAAPPGSTVNVDAYMQLVRDYAQRVDAMLAAQGLPVAPQPVATATPAPSAPDLIRAALAGEYTQAIRSSNAGYLVAHLHPIGIQFYGLAKCQQYFPQVAPDPTFAIEVLSISAPAPFTWTIYGETVGTAQNIYTAHVRLTQRGTTVEADTHFGWDAQQGLQLFSPCRSP